MGITLFYADILLPSFTQNFVPWWQKMAPLFILKPAELAGHHGRNCPVLGTVFSLRKFEGPRGRRLTGPGSGAVGDAADTWRLMTFVSDRR